MLWRLRVLVQEKHTRMVLPLSMREISRQIQWLESWVSRVPFPCTSTGIIRLWYCIVFTQIQVKKSFAACPWRRASRVQISRLIGVYRRVSVFEQRRALLWLGPRVLHGRIPRELPEVDEWRPQHQPANTQVWYLQNETEFNFLFSLLRKYQTKFS